MYAPMQAAGGARLSMENNLAGANGAAIFATGARAQLGLAFDAQV